MTQSLESIEPSSLPAAKASSTTLFWTGLLSALAIIALYNLIFFDRFLPITEGWFSAYAHQINIGKTPYQDFYFFLPPLYPLQLAVFTRIFGESFLALRILGIALILSMTGCLYLIYSRWFAPSIATFAVLVSIVYYQCGNAHITYDFTQFLTAYALFSTLFVIIHCEQCPPSGKALRPMDFRYAIIAGVFSSLAFLTKQSNGAFIFLFAGIAIALATIDKGARHSLRSSFFSLLAPLSRQLQLSFGFSQKELSTPLQIKSISGRLSQRGPSTASCFRGQEVFLRQGIFWN